MEKRVGPEVKSNTTTHEAGVSSAGVFVLQWLTYAFWGWLILGLIWLMVIILSNAISNEVIEGMVPYAIAATVVLLPLAFFVDLFYRRYESYNKQGAESVIMVIHAVLFALCGIGALITAVFVGLSMLIEAEDHGSGQTEVLLTSVFATVLYVAAFIRTSNPLKSKKTGSMYGFGMVILSVLLLAFAAMGPMLKSIQLRDDKRIEQHLSAVNRDIRSYITQHRTLPGSLSDVNFSQDDADALVEDGLVQYKKEGKAPGTASRFASQLRYQLCVNYKQASSKSAMRYSTYSSGPTDDGYKASLSTYRHPAGNVCYKLQVQTFNNNLPKEFEDAIE